MTATIIQKELRELADPKVAEHSARFFKTGKGEYGEGDVFHGIRVPKQRKIAKKYRDLPLNEVQTLLQSDYHEERLTALLILVYRFPKTDPDLQKKIYSFYLSSTDRINNWDLVDSSAPKIVGAWLLNRSRNILFELAKSDNIWERRIAIMATFYFIKQNDFEDTLKIAELLLDDPHDLIHKATGWMLREIGKQNEPLLESFLKPRYGNMPRTMLRYAIEKLPKNKRKAYLKGTMDSS
ncbi:DNA alkylation repair protein [Rhodohalobacter sp. SW132]|uniref:DNA alkylation repair protein n=1 Tax=Rhodohalobacter sp. SW132 TaxID=2293433 RepID=UPI000E28702C|nr:DNA alkylation repair protein [Rhodohalobacter sp. SW132]REL33241.1 DNA alkylation repair protein [Rhodohalobacter sp. SW132]